MTSSQTEPPPGEPSGVALVPAIGTGVEPEAGAGGDARPRWRRLVHDFFAYQPPWAACGDDNRCDRIVKLTAQARSDDVVRLFDVIRSEVKREDDLINQRITWCFVPSAGILATLGAIGPKFDPQATCGQALPLAAAGGALIFTGAMSAWHCLRAVTAARMQIEYLFCTYYENEPQFIACGLPRPFGRQGVHRKGIGYSQRTPLILLVFWGLMLILWLWQTRIQSCL